MTIISNIYRMFTFTNNYIIGYCNGGQKLINSRYIFCIMNTVIFSYFWSQPVFKYVFCIFMWKKIDSINNPHMLAWLKIIVIILEIYWKHYNNNNNNIASSVLCIYIITEQNAYFESNTFIILFLKSTCIY